GDAVELPLGVDRCRAEQGVHLGPIIVAAPEPGDLQALETGCVDLVERGVARASGVAAPESPVPALRPGADPAALRAAGGPALSVGPPRGGQEHHSDDQREAAPADAAHRP